MCVDKMSGKMPVDKITENKILFNKVNRQIL